MNNIQAKIFNANNKIEYDYTFPFTPVMRQYATTVYRAANAIKKTGIYNVEVQIDNKNYVGTIDTRIGRRENIVQLITLFESEV